MPSTPETAQWPPLAFGTGRIGAGWIGIGIAAVAFVVVGSAMLSADAPEAMLAVGPILGIFAAACATVRTVAIDPGRDEVVVTRRLPGLAWTRRRKLDRFRAVAVKAEERIPRHSQDDGTFAGRQRYLAYRVGLSGRGFLPLTEFTVGFDRTGTRLAPELARDSAEDLARRLGATLDLRPERQGYAIEDGGPHGPLTVLRRRAVEALD